MSFGKTRLVEAYTCVSPCTARITDEGFSYTARGEASDVYEITPNSGNYYHVSNQYWPNHSLKQLSGLTGLPTIGFTPDGEGRPNQVSASVGQNPVSSILYNAASLPSNITYRSGDSDTLSYDPNTNRLTQYKFTIGGQSLIGALTWNANSTLQQLNITDPFNTADTQSCSFVHDDLTRIQSGNCGSVWSQTFEYDSFGNITKNGSMSFQPSYSTATNQMTNIAGFTPTYDADGNVLTDPSHTYSWDSDGKPVAIDTVNLTYDALGRMVEQNRSGSFTQLVYGPDGKKLAIYSGQTLQKAFLPLPGGSQVVYNSSGLLYYGHSDHLGSIRVASTPTQTISFDLAYAPFGESYSASGTTDPSFTGQRQDILAGLFDFPDREYDTQGRWPSPDPSGLSSVQAADPQTLNRYAYVRNNPLRLVDPLGLDTCDTIADSLDAPPEFDWGGNFGCGGGGGGGGGFGGFGGGDGFGGFGGGDGFGPGVDLGGFGGLGGGCDPVLDASCGLVPGFGCDPLIDPTCGFSIGVDPTLFPPWGNDLGLGGFSSDLSVGGRTPRQQCADDCFKDFTYCTAACILLSLPFDEAPEPLCGLICVDIEANCLDRCQNEFPN